MKTAKIQEKRSFNVADLGGHTIGSRDGDFTGGTKRTFLNNNAGVGDKHYTKRFFKITLRETEDSIYCNMHKVDEMYPMVSDTGSRFTRLCFDSGKFHDILETPEELGLDRPTARMKEYLTFECEEDTTADEVEEFEEPAYIFEDEGV